MTPSIPPWMSLPFGAPAPEIGLFSPGPPRGLLVHLAAVVRARLEGIVDDHDGARVMRRVERARWAIAVAGVVPSMEPLSDVDLLTIDWPEGHIVPSAPWHAYGCGQEVPPRHRTPDVARGLGVIRWHLERVDGAWQGQDVGRDSAWLIAECLGIRPLLGPIGRDEVERMRERAAHAWRPARGGVVG